VVIGTIDPFAEVAGRGIEKLRNSGAIVTVGIMEAACRELNKRFFTFHQKKRPYIILKWAESLDGFIAPLNILREAQNDKKPVWISNEYSRQLVHKWRSEEQAILAGTKTVLDDNPKLDTRDWFGENPVRIILDRTGKISGDYHVKDQKTKTIVITEQENLTSNDNLIFENVIFDTLLTENISNILYKNNLQSVIIEGGRETLQSFIDTDYWDEARVFIGTAYLKTGIKAPFLNKIPRTEKVKNDQINYFLNYD
ncbi:MAG: bifunctional diaminohydroxyphosphoribosylaminopyrimidine deaminase/5-amino-6-(5-phosphoribosylamino)uracil reductase RibD, partial [Flavobacterium sp.]